MVDDSGPVTIGRVVKAHGLHGEVLVESFSDVPGRFASGTSVRVAARDRTIRTCRRHTGRLLVAFDDVSDRGQAEMLRGASVTAPPVDIAHSDTYYARELVGMAVVTVDGTWWGDVVAVIPVPSVAGYELLEVDFEGRRWLLPDADELVEVADAQGADVLCVIDPPSGLMPEMPEPAPEVPG